MEKRVFILIINNRWHILTFTPRASKKNKVNPPSIFAGAYKISGAFKRVLKKAEPIYEKL